jgi:hypothetical protein
VHAIDLRQEIKLDDPKPGVQSDKGLTSTAREPTYPGPGADTPTENPYNPSFETGAVDFVKRNPTADSRGVTIGVLDSGVDLGHPALRTTTTGERKIVDWVTSTDPIVDNDKTWLPMVSPVNGPRFFYIGRPWFAPAGSYQVAMFHESYTLGGEGGGDLNRDGDSTDFWGVLYDPVNGTVRIDLNSTYDFTDDTPLGPYTREGRRLLGQIRLVNALGSTVGTGTVRVDKAVP